MGLKPLLMLLVIIRLSPQKIDLDIKSDNSSSSIVTKYSFQIQSFEEINIEANALIIFQFPTDYKDILNMNYSCTATVWPTTAPTPICTVNELIMTVSDCFPTELNISSFSLVTIDVYNITNPLYSGSTGSFNGKFVTSTNNDIEVAFPYNGLTISNSMMTCTLTSQPTEINKISNLVVTFKHNNYLPRNSELKLTVPKYWFRSAANTSTNQIISQSTTLNCLSVSKASSNINCNSLTSSASTFITVTNIISTDSNEAISFSIASILNPPSIEPQGSINIVSYNNSKSMQQCTNLKLTGVTSGILSSPKFTTEIRTVNAISKGYLQFIVNSHILNNDTIFIKFPSTFTLNNLTNILIVDGYHNIYNPPITNNSVSIQGLSAQRSNKVSIQLTNVTNPSSETTTQSFQIQISRVNGLMEQLKLPLKFNAIRGTLGITSSSVTSLQIGAISNYIINLSMNNPLQLDSILVILIPAVYQNKINTCLPTPCNITTDKIIFSSLNQAKFIKIELKDVTNPLELGETTSFIAYTQLHQSDDASLVDEVTAGLSFTLVARKMLASQVKITSDSDIVYNNRGTLSLSLSNSNLLPAYSAIIINFPSQITIDTGSQRCNFGSLALQCSYNATSHSLTTSFISPNFISVGDLILQNLTISNVYNPPSTKITSSFNISIINNIGRIIEYVTNGLYYQVNTPASYNTLSLLYNNSQNSAPTSLTVSYSIPMPFYVNQSVLVISFPSTMNMQSVTCQSISTNLISAICFKNINQIKVTLLYSDLSQQTQSIIKIHNFLNYPSLKSYTLSVQLFADQNSLEQICSNSQNPIPIQNKQIGNIKLSSYQFSQYFLLENSKLSLQIQTASSSNFDYLLIRFPLEYQLKSTTSCVVPTGLSCNLMPNNIYNISKNTTSIFILPLKVTINAFVTPSFTPSNPIYIQSFTIDHFMMDRSQQISWNIICVLPCRECNSNNSTFCTSCYTNGTLVGDRTSLEDNSCKSICGTAKYLNNVNNQCQQCSSKCETCRQFSKCLSCIHGSYLYQQDCLVECLHGYYPFSTYCIKCPEALNCEKCSSDLLCLSCKSGYFLEGSSCKESCPPLISYPNSLNLTCDVCPTNCTTCTGTEIQVNCTKCLNGYLLDSNRCYLNCVSLGLVPSGKLCSQCSSQCAACSQLTTNCTSCSSISSNPYFHKNRCLSICPSAYYNDNSTFTCQSCNSPCEICLNISAQSCVSCVSGFILYQTLCLQACPVGYWINYIKCTKCTSPCQECTSSLKCTSCISSYYLYGTKCVDSCGEGLTIINGNQCLVCSSQCKTCSTSTYCTSCYSSNYLYNGTCNIICPNLTYTNSTTLQCSACISLCLFCSTIDYCQSCINSNLYLQNGKCVSTCTTPLIAINKNCVACSSACKICSGTIDNCQQCTDSYYYFTNTSHCSTLCSSNLIIPSTLSNSSNNQCVDTCPELYYINTNNNLASCMKCPVECRLCLSDKNCTTCASTYVFYQFNCELSCPSAAPYNLNNICLKCNISNCQTCTDSNSCSTCQKLYLLAAGQCISSCPTDTTYNLSTLNCDKNPASNNSNTTNTTGNQTDFTVVTSEIPAYLFSMVFGGLAVVSIISRIQYSDSTNLIICLFVVGSICLSVSLGHLLYLQLNTLLSPSFIIDSIFRNLSITTSLLIAVGFIHVIGTLCMITSMLCIKDPSIINIFQQHPLLALGIILLCIIDYKMIWILQTGFFAISVFSTKYLFPGSITLIRSILYLTIFQVLLNITYSIMKLILQDSQNISIRLLIQLSNISIDSPFIIESLIIASVVLIMAIGVLVVKKETYYEGKDKKYNQNNESINYLIEQQVFEKRNNSNHQILDIQDEIVQENSLNLFLNKPTEQEEEKVWTKINKNRKKSQQRINEKFVGKEQKNQDLQKQVSKVYQNKQQISRDVVENDSNREHNSELKHLITSYSNKNDEKKEKKYNKIEKEEKKPNQQNNQIKKNNNDREIDQNDDQVENQQNQDQSRLFVLEEDEEELNQNKKYDQKEQNEIKSDQNKEGKVKNKQQQQYANFMKLSHHQRNKKQNDINKNKVKQNRIKRENEKEKEKNEKNFKVQQNEQNKQEKQEKQKTEKLQKLQKLQKLRENQKGSKVQKKQDANKNPFLKKNGSQDKQINFRKSIKVNENPIKNQSKENLTKNQNENLTNNFDSKTTGKVIQSRKYSQNISNEQLELQREKQREKQKTFITQRPPVISNTPLSADSHTYSSKKIYQKEEYENQSRNQLQDADVYHEKMQQANQCTFVLEENHKKKQGIQNQPKNKLLPFISKKKKKQTQKSINDRKFNTITFEEDLNELNQIIPTPQKNKMKRRQKQEEFIDDIQIYDQKPSELLISHQFIQSSDVNHQLKSNLKNNTKANKPASNSKQINNNQMFNPKFSNKHVIFDFQDKDDEIMLQKPKLEKISQMPKKRNKNRYEIQDPQPTKPSDMLHRGSFQKIGEMTLDKVQHQ